MANTNKKRTTKKNVKAKGKTRAKVTAIRKKAA
jgi:hypothetical protein